MSDRLSAEQAQQRKQLGVKLRQMRTNADLTQRELADKVGLKYYTFVSQLEGGTGKLPSDKIEPYAKAVGVDPKMLAKLCLKHYDPEMYRLLFGKD